VAIPYREPYKENLLRQVPPSIDGLWTTWGFIGTAHAVRRSIFLELGGYDESMVHQGEETDFALSCLKSGYLLLLGRSKEILHYESPKRDNLRMAFYGPRNTIYLLYKYSPFILLFPMLPYVLVRLLFYSANLPAPSRRSYLTGILHGLLTFRFIRQRSPLLLSSYFSYLKLRRQPCLVRF
jgi:GT2 family glycosyltransferase